MPETTQPNHESSGNVMVDSPDIQPGGGGCVSSGGVVSKSIHCDVFDDLIEVIHSTAREKGFWPENRTHSECIALIHSEVSEALEALRHGNPPDDKIPQFSGAEAELADTIIRILDMAGGFHLDVGGALVAKLAYNQTRPYKHGKEF